MSVLTLSIILWRREGGGGYVTIVPYGKVTNENSFIIHNATTNGPEKLVTLERQGMPGINTLKCSSRSKK